MDLTTQETVNHNRKVIQQLKEENRKLSDSILKQQLLLRRNIRKLKDNCILIDEISRNLYKKPYQL